jgi:hypothetical protein
MAVAEGRERRRRAGDDRGGQVGGACKVSTLPLTQLMRMRASKLAARGGR